MSNTVTSDRRATREEVAAHRQALAALAQRHQLSDPRVRGDGGLVVHAANPGYMDVARFVEEAARLVGVYVYVVTDDVPGAQVVAEPL